ncbi:Silent information regulator protein Sir2 [Ruminiclostridium papyrosolvens DSM 2782]|uniref:NAD-dependent protein deacetylase n=1 Tax=Ruminiclostridium papyrosolvens DSM 2782 TaxID=588581 RepID=F1TAT2_9FIRM|nr:NAD-dependent protein deacylase [Ruminiclostridium papyrosolvens]EGD48625.1 Silent information regulator protein Sir2 [Ruminiclostridium papyrosolvens DSM 2782]WES32618.1 NAD-dependent protein deacylase [Ruminiclostridium papyrosolvens DSM 2782]
MNIDILTDIIRNADSIVFFGGAGMSTESGIPDFRSENGLYMTAGGTKYSPETMLSHSFFVSHTDEFFKYYTTKMICKEAKPNSGHIALAKLEEAGRLKAVVTQNIDGLHQLAGSKKVFELHGSVHRNYCTKCRSFYDLDYILNAKAIPRCVKCNSVIKPDVVLYEESLDNDVVSGAINSIRTADVLIIGGTSLVVYPAAGLIDYFRGKKLVLVNKSTTPYDSRADLVINDSVGKVLETAVKPIL